MRDSDAEGSKSIESSSKRRKQNSGGAEHNSDDAARHPDVAQRLRQVNKVLTERNPEPNPEQSPEPSQEPSPESSPERAYNEPEKVASPEILDSPQSPDSSDRQPSPEVQIAAAQRAGSDGEFPLEDDSDEEQLEEDVTTYKPLQEQRPSLKAAPITALETSLSAIPSLTNDSLSPALSSGPSTPTSSQCQGRLPDATEETQEQIAPQTAGNENSIATFQDPQQQRVPAGLTTTAGNASGTSVQELTVSLAYITDPARTAERKAWLQRQLPNDRHAHIYGKLFVDSDRRLYFAGFEREVGTTKVIRVMDDDGKDLRVDRDAYRKALENQRLGGHLFYQRCDGAWRVADLHLDTEPTPLSP